MASLKGRSAWAKTAEASLVGVRALVVTRRLRELLLWVLWYLIAGTSGTAGLVWSSERGLMADGDVWAQRWCLGAPALSRTPTLRGLRLWATADGASGGGARMELGTVGALRMCLQTWRPVTGVRCSGTGAIVAAAVGLLGLPC